MTAERGIRIISGHHFGRTPFALLICREVSDPAKVAYPWLTTWDFGRTGRMFSGREEMADVLGWSVSKLDRALRELQSIGAIRRIRKGLGLVNDIELLADFWPDDHRVVTGDQSESSPVGESESSDMTTPSKRERQERTQETSADPPDPAQESLLGAEDLPPVKERAKSPRELIADALGTVYPFVTDGERQRVGIVATKLAKLDPKPSVEEVTRRARWARAEWESGTVFVVERNWTLIGERLAAGGGKSKGDQRLDDIAAGADMFDQAEWRNE